MEDKLLIDVVQFDEKVGLGTFSGWLAELECSIHHWRADLQQLPPAGDSRPVILLGGYMGVHERQQFPYLQRAADWVAKEVAAGRYILAICLGGQLLAHALGAVVHSRLRQEKGIREIMITETGQGDRLFAGLPDPFVSFEWHNDSFELPAGATHLAATEICSGQVFRYRNAWGLQFHPEVDERVVADWCQRTGVGEEPLQKFRDHMDIYYAHSRQILGNFLAAYNEDRLIVT